MAAYIPSTACLCRSSVVSSHFNEPNTVDAAPVCRKMNLSLRCYELKINQEFRKLKTFTWSKRMCTNILEAWSYQFQKPVEKSFRGSGVTKRSFQRHKTMVAVWNHLGGGSLWWTFPSCLTLQQNATNLWKFGHTDSQNEVLLVFVWL